jgi:hypothetical protein
MVGTDTIGAQNQDCFWVCFDVCKKHHHQLSVNGKFSIESGKRRKEAFQELEPTFLKPATALNQALLPKQQQFSIYSDHCCTATC